MLTPQQGKRAERNRDIPAEVVEEILLNLPVKSLLRFSSVSKAWNSTIFGSAFLKRYRGRGRERILLDSGGGSVFGTASTCLVSNISSNYTSLPAEATDFEAPFRGYKLEASCHELWLARVGKSYFLWNPSMRTYKELPDSSLTSKGGKDFVFGLGFECVGDDYKILQIRRNPPRSCKHGAELYSLKRNSWKEIQNSPKKIDTHGGVFVSGKLHWMPGVRFPFSAIVSFDLLTEKFGEAALPYSTVMCRSARLSVLRGMLCVSLNHEEFCDVWVMEEYDVAKSWAKKFSFKYFDPVSGSKLKPILPLYLYENGEILVIAGDVGCRRRTFVYKDEDTKPREVKIGCCLGNAFLYVDSLVSLL